MLVKYPDVYDFHPGLDGAHQYQIHVSEYHKARAEFAIAELKFIYESFIQDNYDCDVMLSEVRKTLAQLKDNE